MDLFLIRHGQPDWTPNRVARNDPNLTPLGQEQAERVAHRLTSLDQVDQIWASTMNRAMETAEPIASKLGHDMDSFDWLEEIRNPPEWDGAPADEIDRRFAEANVREMDGKYRLHRRLRDIVRRHFISGFNCIS